MRWEDRDGSENLEDRRGQGGGGGGALKGGMGILLVGVITYFMSGGDLGKTFSVVMGEVAKNQTSVSTSTYQKTPHTEKQKRFVSVVLRDTEDVWSAIFAQNGKRYPNPKLVLFSGATSSACGKASMATGPFYCPADKKVYIDLGFFTELENRHNAGGDFARAYVIAHEVAHHVQNVMGTLQKVHNAKSTATKIQSNRLQVKVELQADCYAGIWTHHADKTKNILEAGDIEEALNAASQIGDDTLQKKARGYVVPDSFTHGSSAQRMKWFKIGYETGSISQCNTF